MNWIIGQFYNFLNSGWYPKKGSSGVLLIEHQHANYIDQQPPSTALFTRTPGSHPAVAVAGSTPGQAGLRTGAGPRIGAEPHLGSQAVPEAEVPDPCTLR